MNNHLFTDFNHKPRSRTANLQGWLHLLQDPVSRHVVIVAIRQLFERWHLHPINQAALLGLQDMGTLPDCISKEADPMIFVHIGQLLAIDRALQKRFPYQSFRRDEWIWEPLPQLRGQSPMSLMLREGLDGIKFVRYLLQGSVKQASTLFV